MGLAWRGRRATEFAGRAVSAAWTPAPVLKTRISRSSWCSSARSALLTGLYVPQTALYTTGNTLQGLCTPTMPLLDPGFPTWGDALPPMNPAYQGNVWWLRTWHMCPGNTAAPCRYTVSTPEPTPEDRLLTTLCTTLRPTDFPTKAAMAGILEAPPTRAMRRSRAISSVGYGEAPTSGIPPTPWCAILRRLPPGFGKALCVHFPRPAGNAPSVYTAIPSP